MKVHFQARGRVRFMLRAHGGHRGAALSKTSRVRPIRAFPRLRQTRVGCATPAPRPEDRPLCRPNREPEADSSKH
jgi:hypothetical protein